MNEVTFRTATLADKPILIELEQKVIDAERPFNHLIKPKGAAYYDLDLLLSGQESYLVVAEINEEIIGSGYAQIRVSKQSLNHARHSYLGFMYVSPQFRGRGINKKLINFLLDWSRQQSVSDVYLDVYDGNEGAVRAYEKAGFVKSLVEMKLSLR